MLWRAGSSLGIVLWRAAAWLLPGCAMLAWSAVQAQPSAPQPGVPGAAAPAIPLDNGSLAAPAEGADHRWAILAADDALHTGLPALAETAYRRLLAEEDLSSAQRVHIQLNLVSALIAQRRFDDARQALDEASLGGSPARNLRAAILAHQAGELDRARGLLAETAPAALAAPDVPWYFLLEGFLAEQAGDLESAERSYTRARASTLFDAQRSLFEAAILRQRILSGEASEQTAERLRAKLEANQGRRIGFQFAREYAVVLDQLGRKEEALAVLEEQRRLLLIPENKGEADQLLLLMAMIAGADSAQGRARLEELLLSDSADRADLKIAFNLLTRSERAQRDPVALRELLDELIARGQGGGSANGPGPHPLLDELLLTRARLALDAGNFEAAAADAQRLLDNFPASAFRADALRLRAFIAWSRPEPRYLVAADYLGRLRETTPPGPGRAYLGMLVADCYFLNQNYATAADLYAVVSEDPLGLDRGVLTFQQVLANVRAGQLARAREVLDAALVRGLDPANRWRAEWVIVDALRREGRHGEAYGRLNRELEEPSAHLPPALRLRLFWLRALLAFEDGRNAEAAGFAARLLERVEAARDGVFEGIPRARLLSYALLLRGQALLEDGRPEEGLAAFARLREDHPGNEPAILSFLVEARYYASLDRVVEAQQRLRELAQNHPGSPHAPQALFEAAIAAERRGLEKSYEEAIGDLQTLIDTYPQSPLVSSARLRQGDLLRKLGRFGAALNVYENLINAFPDAGDNAPPVILYRAELARADCLLFQVSRDAAPLGTAVAALERLFDLPRLPAQARVEAGYKWGNVLAANERHERAAEIYWMVRTPASPSPSAAATGWRAPSSPSANSSNRPVTTPAPAPSMPSSPGTGCPARPSPEPGWNAWPPPGPPPGLPACSPEPSPRA